MKKLFFRLLFAAAVVGPAGHATAQHTAPLSVLAPAGGDGLTATGDFYSYTLGQTAFAVGGTARLGVEEGVQQVFCLPVATTAEYAFCQNEAAQRFAATLPADYTLTGDFDTLPGVYQYMLHTLTEAGCDSVVSVHLTVLPTYDTLFTAQAEGCYRWQGQDWVASGTYSHPLRSVAGCDSTLRLQLLIMPEGMPLPSIYAYRDRVLMVDRLGMTGDTTRYYGYRWYRNGALVAEGSEAYSYQEGGAALNGCYRVEVAVDSARTAWAVSNELCLGNLGIDLPETLALDVAPNPVRRGGVVRVGVDLAETQLQGAMLTLYDVQGRRVMQRAAMQLTQLVADLPAGVYSLHLSLPSGRHAARKLVVR